MVRIPFFMGSLESGSVRPLIYGKTAKPLSEFEGSAHLKNIPTNSPGDGVVSGRRWFLLQGDIKHPEEVFLLFFIIISLFHTFCSMYFNVRAFYSSLVKDCRLAIESSNF